MLISELIGYKSNPIYQKAKSTFVSRYKDPDYIERRNQMSNFTIELTKHGFNKVGSGSFGIVYEKPGYPWLFKIFHIDPAYLEFLKWAIKNQSNPYIPKIKGKILKINNDTFAVRMEKLQRFNDTGNEKLELFYNKLLDLGYFGFTDEVRDWFDRNFPGFSDIIDALKKSKFKIDIHTGNIMMRGEVPVIIDPLFDPKSLG